MLSKGTCTALEKLAVFLSLTFVSTVGSRVPNIDILNSCHNLECVESNKYYETQKYATK